MSHRQRLAHSIARRQMAWGLGVNLAGAAVAFAYLGLVFRPDPDVGRISIARNLIALAVYLLVATTISSREVRGASRALREYAASDRPPTVIGDPVNEAARLTEPAKQRPERLLAGGRTTRATGDSESSRWRLEGEVVLRGRAQATQVAVPRV